jgi:chromosome segregation ATPase
MREEFMTFLQLASKHPELFIVGAFLVLALAVTEILVLRSSVKLAQLERDEALDENSDRAALVVSQANELEARGKRLREAGSENHRLYDETRTQAKALLELQALHDQSKRSVGLLTQHLNYAQGQILRLEGDLMERGKQIHEHLNNRDEAQAKLEELHARHGAAREKISQLEEHIGALEAAAVTFGRQTGKTQTQLDVLEALDESARLCDAEEAKAAAERKAKEQAAADRLEVVRLNKVVIDLNGQIQKLTKDVRNEVKLRTDAQEIHDARESDFQANMTELRATIQRQAKKLEQGEFTVSMASVRGELLRMTTARDEAQAKADRLRDELEGVGEHTTRIIDQRNEAREGCRKLRISSDELRLKFEQANRELTVLRNRLEVIDRIAIHGFKEETQAPQIKTEKRLFTYTFGPSESWMEKHISSIPGHVRPFPKDEKRS